MLNHGTITAYTNYRCRCDECKAAWSDYQKTLRVARQPPPPGDDRHGKASTYTNWHCRCAACREAHTQIARIRRRVARRATGSLT